jgi:hypothetical protein
MSAAHDYSIGYPDKYETEAECDQCGHAQLCLACPGKTFMTPCGECLEWIYIETPKGKTDEGNTTDSGEGDPLVTIEGVTMRAKDAKRWGLID